MAEWDGSLHSHTDFRSAILKFRDAHIQRDEVAAEESIGEFGLRDADRWGQLMVSRNKMLWFVQAVGYLLLAIMPRRDRDDTDSRLVLTENVWEPSNEARSFAESRRRSPWKVDAIGNRRYGAFTTTVKKRHLPIEGGQKGLGDRRTLLEKLKVEATIRELSSDVREDITETFWVAHRQAEADARLTDDRDWLPNFALSIRDWISEKTENHIGMASASQVADYNGAQPMEYLQDDPALQPLRDGQPSGASSRNAKLAKSVRPDQSWQSTYYTIAEVGNHKSRGDLWALLDDGSGGFDVYDVTGRFST